MMPEHSTSNLSNTSPPAVSPLLEGFGFRSQNGDDECDIPIDGQGHHEELENKCKPDDVEGQIQDRNNLSDSEAMEVDDPPERKPESRGGSTGQDCVKVIRSIVARSYGPGEACQGSVHSNTYPVPPAIVFPVVLDREYRTGYMQTGTVSNSFGSIGTIAGGFIQGEGPIRVGNNGVSDNGHLYPAHDNPINVRQNVHNLTNRFDRIRTIGGGVFQGRGPLEMRNNGKIVAR